MYRKGTCFFQILYYSLSNCERYSWVSSHIYLKMIKKKEKTSGEVICEFFKL